jgi:gamma-carbonic anhydrase
VIKAHNGKEPILAEDVFVAPGAVVIGDVQIAEGASVWYNTVIRGDEGYIKIGERTNIQDLCMLHTTGGLSNMDIGADVTVGHNAILHGCNIGDRCLIGMGAVIMDNAVIGAGSVVAAGAVVLEGSVVPPNSVVAGIPAKVKKTAPDGQELFYSAINAAHYRERAAEHAALHKQDE